mgnify:CR=1 FL=1
MSIPSLSLSKPFEMKILPTKSETKGQNEESAISPNSNKVKSMVANLKGKFEISNKN